MYIEPRAGERGLEYMRCDITGLEADWKYRGIPIFISKREERIVYRIWYGSEVYELGRLTDAMATVDTILQIVAWKLLLPPREVMVCPVCDDYVGERENTFGHYMKKHVKNAYETIRVLAQFEHDWCENYWLFGIELGAQFFDRWMSNETWFQPIDFKTVKDILKLDTSV